MEKESVGYEDTTEGEKGAVCFEMMLLRESSIGLWTSLLTSSSPEVINSVFGGSFPRAHSSSFSNGNQWGNRLQVLKLHFPPSFAVTLHE